MAQPTRQMPREGQIREEERSQDKTSSVEDWYSRQAPSIVLNDEEFKAFQEALHKPQKASPALKGLFARKRKL